VRSIERSFIEIKPFDDLAQFIGGISMTTPTVTLKQYRTADARAALRMIREVVEQLCAAIYLPATFSRIGSWPCLLDLIPRARLRSSASRFSAGCFLSRGCLPAWLRPRALLLTAPHCSIKNLGAAYTHGPFADLKEIELPSRAGHLSHGRRHKAKARRHFCQRA